jgi:anti-sigma factor ChrR (cupin superfamily)
MNTQSNHMACDGFAEKLADYLEGDLPGAGRDAMDAHASTCAECRQLVSELESLRVDAASLPLLEPSRDLWAGIAERIDARVLPLDASRSARTTTVRRTWRHPAVAAAALVLVTAGVTHLWTRYSYETPAAGLVPAGQVAAASELAAPAPDSDVAEPASTATSSESPAVRRLASGSSRGGERPAAGRSAGRPDAVLVSRSPNAGRIMRTEVEPVYDREIVKLRAIVRDRRAQLDPKTVAVLEQSIAVIDSAIAQSRAALAKDPASGFLATQLNHSLEKKVELLRTAALLPART